MVHQISWALFWYNKSYLGMEENDFAIIDTLTKDNTFSKTRRQYLLGDLKAYFNAAEYRFGDEISGWEVALNTAIVLGNDLLKFLAYLDAQCEIHCYVLEEDKGSFANMLSEGLEHGVIPETLAGEDKDYDSGWKDVINLLRNSTGPVVLSYSVCDVFPEEKMYRGDDLERSEDQGNEDKRLEEEKIWWDSLSHEEKWDYNIETLTKDESLRLFPGKKDGFGNGVSIFDINKKIHKMKGGHFDKVNKI
jgi:hypothetical protein